MNNLIINVLTDLNQFLAVKLPLDVDIYKHQSEVTVEAVIMSHPHLHVTWEIEGVTYRLEVAALTPAIQKVWLHYGDQPSILVTQSAWEVDDYNEEVAKQLIECYESSISLIHLYNQQRSTIKLLNHIVTDVEVEEVAPLESKAEQAIREYEAGNFQPINRILKRGYARMLEDKKLGKTFKTVVSYLNGASDTYTDRYVAIIECIAEVQRTISSEGLVTE